MEMEEVQIKQEPADNSDDELDEAIEMEAHLQDMNASDFCARSMKVFTHEKTPRIMNRRKYRGDMNFIQAVARVGQALLDRSQAPEAKQEKRRAAQRVGELLWKECGFQYTVEQVYKKVANLKHRAKLTVERSKHIPPDLKMWLDLLPAEQRARISACRLIPGSTFKIVDEREDIITVNAAELHSDDESLFMAQLQGVKKRRKKQRLSRQTMERTRPTCPICWRLIIKSKLSSHIALHRENRLFCATNCGADFEKLEECELHEHSAHGLTNLQCNVCNHKFRDYDALELHRNNMHSKLERHVCSMCREWFISQAEVREHWQALPRTCGRILRANEQASTKRNYAIKSDPSATMNLKKLKLKAVDWEAPVTADNPSEAIDTPIVECDIQIKQEALDDEYAAIAQPLPASTEIETIQSEVTASTFTDNLPCKIKTEINQLQDVRIKTEAIDFEAEKTMLIAKAPMRSPPVATHTAAEPTIIPIHPMTNTVAYNVTPNFTLKTLQNITTKTAPTSNTGVKLVSAPKVLKLQNLKIVKFPPKFDPKLVSTVPATTTLVNQPANAGHMLLPDKKPTVKLQTSTLYIEGESPTKDSKFQKLLDNANLTVKRIVSMAAHPRIIKLPLGAVNTNINQQQAAQLKQQPAMAAADSSKPDMDNVDLSIVKIEPIDTQINDAAVQTESQLLQPQSKDHSLPLNTLAKKPKEHFYDCPHCSRGFCTKTALLGHISTRCRAQMSYQCGECNKRFSSAGTLAGHRTVHTGELPHKCNFCDKRFRTRGQVTVHHRTHTGERPFVCEVCTQSFRHRETLISHLSRHIGMKRYKCYCCNKQFACISGLRMHRVSRPDTCGKAQLNTRALGPRVRVIKGQVMFEPDPPANSYRRATPPPSMRADAQQK